MFNILKAKRSPPIQLFVRHCNFSSVSQHKHRHPFFSRQACFDNLVRTMDPSRVHLTCILDNVRPADKPHFLLGQKQFPVIEIQEGTETGSFLKMVDIVINQKLHPETIVYFLEDDYLHRPGWVDVLLEGFSVPHADYVTLYDHRDKYFLPMYQNLQTTLTHTSLCHWRTTPSTTNTYAMRFKTLKAHLDIHRQFSLNRTITDDHGKFCRLAEMDARLISPIPGWSTHMEPDYASPCINWETMEKSE